MSIVVEHLPAEVMWMTPSHAEGLDEDTELALRVYGCELIQEAGILLKLYVMAVYQASTCLFMLACSGHRPLWPQHRLFFIAFITRNHFNGGM
jgi:hypothetical protein